MRLMDVKNIATGKSVGKAVCLLDTPPPGMWYIFVSDNLNKLNLGNRVRESIFDHCEAFHELPDWIELEMDGSVICSRGIRSDL